MLMQTIAAHFALTRVVAQPDQCVDYRMPTCLDLPMIETVIVEVPTPGLNSIKRFVMNVALLDLFYANEEWAKLLGRSDRSEGAAASVSTPTGPPSDLSMIAKRIARSTSSGVRGVGEGSIVPPPAAVANAIYRAVGIRLRPRSARNLTQLAMSTSPTSCRRGSSRAPRVAVSPRSAPMRT